MSCFKWEALLPNQNKGPKDKQIGDPKPDAYMGTEFVYGLDADTFGPFVKSKDITLVMFYEPDCEESKFAKKHFKKAAKLTKRDNHAYAAVDCKSVPGICCSQNIPKLPYFKLFTRGSFVGFNDNYKTFVHKDMRKWVELFHAFTPQGHRLPPTYSK